MKPVLYILLLLVVNISAWGQSVGIKTTNPQALFHIDAKGNNGSGAANKYADDVVIGTSGNLTIGSQTVSSTAKVSVTAGSNMMITAGQQPEVGMSLISDANGYASWGLIVGATGIFEDRIRIGQPTAPFTLVGTPPGTPLFYNDLPNSNYTAKEDGLHFFEIRYCVTVNAAGVTPINLTVANHFRLMDLSGIAVNPILDEYEGYQSINTTNNQALAFYTSVSAYLKKNQKVNLQLRVGRGPQPTIKALNSWGADDHLFEVVVKRYNF